MSDRNAHIEFSKIEKSEEFQALKKRKYKFIFTVPILFFLYYLTFPVLSAYAKGLMSTFVVGNFTFGYLFGLSYYFVIWGLAFLYVFVAKSYDRQVDEIIAKYAPSEVNEKGA